MLPGTLSFILPVRFYPPSQGCLLDSRGAGLVKGAEPAWLLPEPSSDKGDNRLGLGLEHLGLELEARRPPRVGDAGLADPPGVPPLPWPRRACPTVSEPHPNSRRLCQGDWKFLLSGFSG